MLTQYCPSRIKVRYIIISFPKQDITNQIRARRKLIRREDVNKRRNNANKKYSQRESEKIIQHKSNSTI